MEPGQKVTTCIPATDYQRSRRPGAVPAFFFSEACLWGNTPAYAALHGVLGAAADAPLAEWQRLLVWRGRRRKPDRRRVIPAAPADLVAGLGAMDRQVFVSPSLALVIVRTGMEGPDRGFRHTLWGKLMAMLPAD